MLDITIKLYSLLIFIVGVLVGIGLDQTFQLRDPKHFDVIDFFEETVPVSKETAGGY